MADSRVKLLKLRALAKHYLSRERERNSYAKMKGLPVILMKTSEIQECMAQIYREPVMFKKNKPLIAQNP